MKRSAVDYPPFSEGHGGGILRVRHVERIRRNAAGAVLHLFDRARLHVGALQDAVGMTGRRTGHYLKRGMRCEAWGVEVEAEGFEVEVKWWKAL